MNLPILIVILFAILIAASGFMIVFIAIKESPAACKKRKDMQNSMPDYVSINKDGIVKLDVDKAYKQGEFKKLASYGK